MMLIGVFFCVWGCQGTIIILFLPSPPLFQASMILHVSFILEHFFNFKVHVAKRKQQACNSSSSFFWFFKMRE
jgi:hypothetical protein